MKPKNPVEPFVRFELTRPFQELGYKSSAIDLYAKKAYRKGSKTPFSSVILVLPHQCSVEL